MKTCLSTEAQSEITRLKVDPDCAEALRACIEMLSIDANEFEGRDGFSIRRVGGLFRRGVRLYRMKYEKYAPGKRVLFFSVPSRQCVFVTGVHDRSELGTDYNFAKEPFVRALRYWGLRERLC
jgi:hypothetical protein